MSPVKRNDDDMDDSDNNNKDKEEHNHNLSFLKFLGEKKYFLPVWEFCYWFFYPPLGEGKLSPVCQI